MTHEYGGFDAVHAMGNGQACAYGRGPDILQVFGPDYSAPTACSMILEDCNNISFTQQRTEGTSVWEHDIFEAGTKTGRIRDFAAADKPVFFRRFALSSPLRFKIAPEQDFFFLPLPESCAGRAAFLLEIPEGKCFYTHSFENGRPRGYVTTEPNFLALGIFDGASGDDAGISAVLSGGAVYLSAGRGTVCFAFGKNPGGAISQLYGLGGEREEREYAAALADWRGFTARRRAAFDAGGLEPAADGVACLIRAQQARSGGVLAGYNYHLAYVRDNYGVLRGLLAMGCLAEAERLCDFYLNVFGACGRVHNAQSCAGPGFHIHENDASEITGYLCLMILELASRLPEGAALKYAPLLEHLLALQRKELRNGMLPFNGDETYIAGGILPRSAINHGSAEATMLYHRAAAGLLAVPERFGLRPDTLEYLRRDAAEIEKNYLKNFFHRGVFYCNSPGYYEKGSEPPFRHGVRACGHGFGHCIQNAGGEYVCPACATLPSAGGALSNDTLYRVSSPLLMADFAGSGLIPERILGPEISALAEGFLLRGALPSSPGGEITVGYDYGILLQSLVKRGPPGAADRLYTAALSLCDCTGAWSEYYRNGRPAGTRCRPWESAINIAALLDAGRVQG